LKLANLHYSIKQYRELIMLFGLFDGEKSDHLKVMDAITGKYLNNFDK
jgi:hypothetical protein